MMNDPKIMQIFADAGAVVTDSHFVYTSGRHSSIYINKDALYLHPPTISTLCELMARPYDPETIDIVVGPVLGGIVLSQWVAYHLAARKPARDVLAAYAEKEGDGPNKGFAFHRGYEHVIPGKNILIVEDLLTTGGSVRKVVELVRQHGGNVVGLSLLCNRGRVKPADVGNVPIQSLLSIDLETYTQEECPFCRQGVPINTQLGKGRLFL